MNQVHNQSYQVNIFKADLPHSQLTELKNNPSVCCVDTMEQQIKELIKVKTAGKPLSEEELQSHKSEILGAHTIDTFGNWIHYPWSNTLVHLLPENEYIAVRTNRNKLKITEEEQQILLQKKVGIIGLSVGQSVALTMAIERTCGELRLADFDTLDLSNLNRLRAGVHQIGLHKTIIAAREIAEIDPYLKVTVYSEGITDDNLDTFLGNEDSKIDILVEVCDGIDTKIKARKAARSKQIPVIMDTNDKGMIDIERFDLEPVRKLLHGFVDDDIIIANLSPEQRLQMLMRMVSYENISERLKLSVPEMGKTISSWPQLASSVMLGGAATTDTCRRILLNHPVQSGRYYIDFEQLIG